MSEEQRTKDQQLKTCPACGKEYIAAPDDNCCAECFKDFNGMTVEELEQWLSQ